MSAWDSHLRLNTPKLKVPTEFIPTRPHDRGWLIPFFDKNPAWTIPLAIVPAIIATILIFMDQQITAVIINRKEFKLKVERGTSESDFEVIFLLLLAVVEKTRLSSGLVHSLHNYLDSIVARFAVVRRSDGLSLDARQCIEDYEWKFRARRKTEISGRSVRVCDADRRQKEWHGSIL